MSLRPTQTLETIGFYQSLGCKRLGDIVQEEPHGTVPTVGATAKNVQNTIFERLPFFLEHNHTATQATTWLRNDGNFIIRTFKKVTVTRSINFAGARASITVEASATAKREGEGAIELWLTDGPQVDMYEIATSLCRFLFNTRKVNHALLLMTILSSDLHTLRRRGYPGDYEVPSFLTPLTGFR